MLYASSADYTADAAWLVTRLPDSMFYYLEGFTFVNNGDPVNSIREWRPIPTAVVEIVMISIGLHRPLLSLIGAWAASGKRLIIFGFYASSGDHQDTAATVLLDEHLASEHIPWRPLSEKSIVFGFEILLLVLVSGQLTPEHGKAFGVLHSQEDVKLELPAEWRMNAAG